MRKITVGTEVVITGDPEYLRINEGTVVAIVKNYHKREYIVQFRHPVCWRCFKRRELI